MGGGITENIFIVEDNCAYSVRILRLEQILRLMASRGPGGGRQSPPAARMRPVAAPASIMIMIIFFVVLISIRYSSL